MGIKRYGLLWRGWTWSTQVTSINQSIDRWILLLERERWIFPSTYAKEKVTSADTSEQLRKTLSNGYEWDASRMSSARKTCSHKSTEFPVVDVCDWTWMIVLSPRRHAIVIRSLFFNQGTLTVAFCFRSILMQTRKPSNVHYIISIERMASNVRFVEYALHSIDGQEKETNLAICRLKQSISRIFAQSSSFLRCVHA